MSSTTQINQSEKPPVEGDVANSDNQEEIARIAIDELIIGRTLESPLFDLNGVLLLAEGSSITSDIKDKLKARGLEEVGIHKDDVNKVTLRDLEAEENNSTFKFNSELTEKIDQMIDCGRVEVKNTGDAVKDSVKEIGRKGYDKAQRKRLKEQHSQNGQKLDQMLMDAVHGKPMDGQQVVGMAGDYLKEMMSDTDSVLTSAISRFQKDNISARSLECSLLAMAIGIELGLDSENIHNLSIAGLVHDWGMMLVPEEIRNAPRFLSQVEMIEIKKHPIHSLEMIQNVSSLPRVISTVVYQVHECFNGTGYPRGRHGNGIHQFSRILQVADSYISLTSDRPYRKPLMRYSAMECLLNMAKARSVDPEVVRALLKIQSLFPIGSYVTLTDGSVAKVIRSNRNNYTKPVVVRVQHATGDLADQNEDSNLIDLSSSEVGVEQALPAPGSNEEALDPDKHLKQFNFKR